MESHEIESLMHGLIKASALNIAKTLSHYSISAGVIDLFKIKPTETKRIWSVIKETGYIVPCQLNKGIIPEIVLRWESL